ncbi:MAG: hypothetical protein ACRDXX_13155, partial [Stackebrandtia sp.]
PPAPLVIPTTTGHRGIVAPAPVAQPAPVAAEPLAPAPAGAMVAEGDGQRGLLGQAWSAIAENVSRAVSPEAAAAVAACARLYLRWSAEVAPNLTRNRAAEQLALAYLDEVAAEIAG